MNLNAFDVSTWHILLVDDEPDSIATVKMVLEANNAIVYEARNGVEGIDCFEQKRPNLILTDISMPEMDGWELLKRIRVSVNGTLVPVIAITAHAMAGDKEKVLNAGFDGYLGKPITMFTLIDNLRSMILDRQ